MVCTRLLAGVGRDLHNIGVTTVTDRGAGRRGGEGGAFRFDCLGTRAPFSSHVVRPALSSGLASKQWSKIKRRVISRSQPSAGIFYWGVSDDPNTRRLPKHRAGTFEVLRDFVNSCMPQIAAKGKVVLMIPLVTTVAYAEIDPSGSLNALPILEHLQRTSSYELVALQNTWCVLMGQRLVHRDIRYPSVGELVAVFLSLSHREVLRGSFGTFACASHGRWPARHVLFQLSLARRPFSLHTDRGHVMNECAPGPPGDYGRRVGPGSLSFCSFCMYSFVSDCLCVVFGRFQGLCFCRGVSVHRNLIVFYH
jgi:hypothetical protein